MIVFTKLDETRMLRVTLYGSFCPTKSDLASFQQAQRFEQVGTGLEKALYVCDQQ